MITNITLKNFRCFFDLSLDVSNSLVIFSGRNATGKTSILEALYLCSTSKSHRTNDISTVIKKETPYATISVKENKNYKYVISKEGKTAYINKTEIKKISDFIGNLSVVLYSPLDINLVNGTKSDKRKFLDMEISLLDKKYLNSLNSYKKILQERNELLKQNKVDLILLDILDKSLEEHISFIYQKRISFINRMNELLIDIVSHLNTENIRLVYKSSYDPINIYDSIKKHEKSDLMMKVTSIGIHRDEFVILMNEKDAKEYASEGQARLICIAIKLALKEYIREITGKDPILLLDDVFAALDKTRIESLVKYVTNSYQTFITATSILEIPDVMLKNALVIRIEKER